MSFSAKSLLYNIETKDTEEVVITCQEDIFNLIGDGKVGSVNQVNIDLHHKVFYENTDRAMEKGVSAHIKVHAYKDKSIGRWVKCEGTEFVTGDKLLLVLCDDKVPIDMTEDAKQFILSCIK